MKKYEEIEKIFNTKTPWSHFVIKDWLPQDFFNEIKELIVNSYNNKDMASYDTAYGRWMVRDMPFNNIPNFNDRILKYVKEALKPHDPDWDNYISVGRFGWKYESVDGVIPSLIGHMDTHGGNVQFDMVIDKTFNWGLYIGDKMYEESNPNEVIVFNGQELWHGRPKWEDYSKSKDDYLVVEFFAFAPKNHWFVTHGPDYLEVSRSIQRVRGLELDNNFEEAEKVKEKIVMLYNSISITKELSAENESLICEQKKLSDELKKDSVPKKWEY